MAMDEIGDRHPLIYTRMPLCNPGPLYCKILPCYLRRTAVSEISGTLANALDNGQSCFAAAAIL